MRPLTPWRLPAASWQRHRVTVNGPCRGYHDSRQHVDGNGHVHHRHERTVKAFTRRTDGNGEVYYTVATKEEGKDMPKMPRLFEMPDIILDLDAETIENLDSRRVREYTAADEERLDGEWAVSPKHKAVKARMRQLSVMLDHSRSKARELDRDAAHPLHITEYDVLSVALRGFDGGNDTTGKARNSVLRKHPRPAQFVIRRFSNIYPKDDESPELPTAEPSHGNIPGYMRQLRVGNGIPSYAARDDERLMRWMMIRRDSLGSAEDGPRPSSVVLATAIREQKTERGGIAMIRRIVFGGIDRGCSLDDSVAIAIRDSCVRILDAFAGHRPPHYEVLALVNNLAARVPSITGGSDVAGCVLFGLRTRSLAGLGLVQQAASQLRERTIGGRRVGGGSSGMLAADVHASMGSWLEQLGGGENPALATRQGKKALFCILTGFGQASFATDTDRGTEATASDTCPARACSYRSIIKDHVRVQEPPGKSDLFARYVELLGRLGAVGTLRGEWAEVQQQEEEQQSARHGDKGSGGDDTNDRLGEGFRRAMAVASEMSGLTIPGDGVPEPGRGSDCLRRLAEEDYARIGQFKD
ncbi:hypothetical protein GMORB2_2281 [Geosmithia morbida]|uniref:Uncharacterized protein n=1 Tax=Geosmithia morbida TaxID=1094350 RepID=A0A9P4YUM3_9HYPO|nr:uncharacterized protein GMORB2_2281 [Geosmithia morbida]KAF4121319.1 hypothetical protein GMORB2_2281 [Geosmithia morbida]